MQQPPSPHHDLPAHFFRGYNNGSEVVDRSLGVAGSTSVSPRAVCLIRLEEVQLLFHSATCSIAWAAP
jgi:hypothetical protein